MRWWFSGPDSRAAARPTPLNVLVARDVRLAGARVSSPASTTRRPRVPDGVGDRRVRHGPPTRTSAPAERRSADPLRTRRAPGGGSCTSRGLAGARYHGLSDPRRGRLLLPLAIGTAPARGPSGKGRRVARYGRAARRAVDRAMGAEHRRRVVRLHRAGRAPGRRADGTLRSMPRLPDGNPRRSESGLARRLVLDHGGQPHSPPLALGAVASMPLVRARPRQPFP